MKYTQLKLKPFYLWKGQPLECYTKRELIKIVIELGETSEARIEQLKKEVALLK